MKALAKFFLQGLLYITPISVTAYVLYWVFRNLDSMIEFPYPGLGILVLVLVITAIGFIGSYLIQLPVFSFIDSRLERAPLIKIVYTSMKDLIKAFVGQKKNFNQPVLVKLYENSELRRLGFVTDEALTALDEDTNLTTVYVPHSFAISGQLFLVPPSYISPIKSSSTEVMKYIIAGGVAKIEDDEIHIE